jgi:hypothetical protein
MMEEELNMRGETIHKINVEELCSMLFDSEQKALKLQAGHGFIQFVDDYSMPD